jgi:alpha-L-rhamnosidase
MIMRTTRKRVLSTLAIAGLLLLPRITAAQPAPALHIPTAAEVASTWRNPPSEYGPQPYVDLSGQVSQPEIQRDLDEIKRLGFRAITVQAGVSLPFEYLSPQYFAFFQMLVAEAKQRDLRVWIVDDIGYPSGFAGGKFTRDAPDLRMQTLAIGQRLTLNAGTALNQPVPPATVAVTAISPNADTIDIPIANGRIAFTAPAGAWQILFVEHRFETSPTRSETNLNLATEPRPNTNNAQAKDRSQSLFDYLDHNATRQFLSFTHDQYKKYLGAEFGHTILGFRGDEPDYSVAGLPWTPAFFDRFTQIKGYDIRPYVATFLQPRTATLTPEQTRARADYWDVFSQLFSDSFFKLQADWCAANHLEYQVHLNHEEAELDLAHSEGDFFRDMRSVQVPGIDMTRHQIWTDTISDFPRLASSEAHIYGKPHAFTESFASSKPIPSAAVARYILNQQFVRGINMAEIMYFPTSNPGGRPRTELTLQPEFPALMTYIRRLSYLTSQGAPTASVALYLPTSSLWLHDQIADTQFVSTERLLSEHQIDFDIVSEDALARDLALRNGKFATLSGNAYRTVIIPSASLITQAALDRLRTFAAAGGRVVFLGRTPSLIAARTILNAHTAAPADFSWATLIPADLPPTPTPGDQPPAQPPTPQNIPTDVLQSILATLPPQAITLARPDSALRVLKRRWKNADLYLLFNEGPTASTHTITLSGPARNASAWDPQTGESKPVHTVLSHDGLKLSVTLQAYDTLVLVTQP